MSKLEKGYGSGGMQAILGDMKTYYEGELAKKANTSDIPVITGKADKVTNATSGNLAGLDANGNLTDSGVSPTEEVTVEGNPVTFDSPFEQDAKSVVVSVKPIQDLHGYDHPWVGGAYKNKLPMTVARIKAANTDGTWTGNVYTISDATFEILTDNADNVTGIKVNGTPSLEVRFSLHGFGNGAVFSENAIMTGCPSGGSNNSYKLYISNNATSDASDTGNGVSLSPELFNSAIYNSLFTWIVISANYTATNLIFYPMIRLATESDATFAPYSNICPISGIDEVEIEVSDGESEPTTTTIPLPSTLYDADVDVTNGDVDSRYGIVDLGDLEWNLNAQYNVFYAYVTGRENGRINIQSECFKVVNKYFTDLVNGEMSGAESNNGINIKDDRFDNIPDFVTAVTGSKLVFELATPTAISFTPADVELLEGTNVVSTNGEKVAVTYKAGILATLGDIDDLNDKVKTKFDKVNVATIETGSTASKTYYKGDYIVRSDGCLYDVTATILSGAAFTSSNTHKTTIGDELNKFKTYVSTSNSPINGNDVDGVSIPGYLPISPFQVFSWTGSGTVSITPKSSGGTWSVSGDVSNVRYGQIFMRT